MKKDYIVYPDLLRTIAAVFVILLHVIMPYFTSAANFGKPLWWVIAYVNELTRVGVPIFFMLSGYLLIYGLLSRDALTDLGGFYKKRFGRLLLPFAAWSVIYFVYYRVSAGQAVFSADSFREFFRRFINEGTAYHLWYLYSIAMLYLILPFFAMIVQKCESSAKPLPKLFLFLALLTFQPTIKPFFNTLTGLYFNFTADGFVGYFGYAFLGYILGRYDLGRAKYAVYALGAVSFAVFPILNGQNILSSGDFFWNGGYTLNHYLEAAAVFLLAKDMLAKVSENTKPAYVLSRLSSMTFAVYLTHVLVLELANRYLTPRLSLALSVFMAVTFASVTVVCFLLAWLYTLLTRGLRAITKK